MVGRGNDAMENRVSSGQSSDFAVEIQEASTPSVGEGRDASPVTITPPVYAGNGEYSVEYNVTKSGDYALHVRIAYLGKKI